MKTKPGQAQEFDSNNAYKSRSATTQNSQPGSNSRRNFTNNASSAKVVSGSKYVLKPVQLSSMRMGESSSLATASNTSQPHAQLQQTSSDSANAQWRTSASAASGVPREQAWRPSDGRNQSGQNSRSWSSVAGHSAPVASNNFSGTPLGEANFPPLPGEGAPVSAEPQLKPQGAGFWIQRQAHDESLQPAASAQLGSPIRNYNQEIDSRSDDERRSSQPQIVYSPGGTTPVVMPTLPQGKPGQPHAPPVIYSGQHSYPPSMYRQPFPPNQMPPYGYVPSFPMAPPGIRWSMAPPEGGMILPAKEEKRVDTQNKPSDSSKPWKGPTGPKIPGYREVDYSAQINFSDDETEEPILTQPGKLLPSNFEDSHDKIQDAPLQTNTQSHAIQSNHWQQHDSNKSHFDQPNATSQAAKLKIEPPPVPSYPIADDDDECADEVMAAVERARRHRLELQQRQQRLAEGADNEKSTSSNKKQSQVKSDSARSSTSRHQNYYDDQDYDSKRYPKARPQPVPKRSSGDPNSSNHQERQNKKDNDGEDRGKTNDPPRRLTNETTKTTDKQQKSTNQQPPRESSHKPPRGGLAQRGGRGGAQRGGYQQRSGDWYQGGEGGEWGDEYVDDDQHWGSGDASNQYSNRRGGSRGESSKPNSSSVQRTSKSQNYSKSSVKGEDNTADTSKTVSDQCPDDALPDVVASSETEPKSKQQQKPDLSGAIAKTVVNTSPRRRELPVGRGTGRGIASRGALGRYESSASSRGSGYARGGRLGGQYGSTRQNYANDKESYWNNAKADHEHRPESGSQVPHDSNEAHHQPKGRRYTPSVESGSNPARATSADINEQWETASETSIDHPQTKRHGSQQKMHEKGDNDQDDWNKTSHNNDRYRRSSRRSGGYVSGNNDREKFLPVTLEQSSEAATGGTNLPEGRKEGQRIDLVKGKGRNGVSSSQSPAPKRQLAAQLSGDGGSSSRTRSGSNSSPSRPHRPKPNPLKDIDLNNIAGVVNIDTIAPSATSNVDDFVLGDDGETVLIDNNADGFQQVVSKKDRRQAKKVPTVSYSEATKGAVAVAVAVTTGQGVSRNSSTGQATIRGQSSNRGQTAQQQPPRGLRPDAKNVGTRKQHQQQIDISSKSNEYSASSSSHQSLNNNNNQTTYDNSSSFTSWDPSTGGPLPPPLLGPSPKSSSSRHRQQSSPASEKVAFDLQTSVTSAVHGDLDNEDDVLGPKSQQLLCNISNLTHLSATAEQPADDQSEQQAISASSKSANTSGIVGEAVWSAGADSFAPQQNSSTETVNQESQKQGSSAAVNFQFIYDHQSADSASSNQQQPPSDFTSYWQSLTSANSFIPSNESDFAKQQFAPLQVTLSQAAGSSTLTQSNPLSPPRRPDNLSVPSNPQQSSAAPGSTMQMDQLANIRQLPVSQADVYFQSQPQLGMQPQQPQMARYAFQAPAPGQFGLDDKAFHQQQHSQANQQQFAATIAAGLPIHLGAPPPPQAQQPLHPTLSGGPPQATFQPMDSNVLPPGLQYYPDQFGFHASYGAHLQGFQSAPNSAASSTQGSQLFQQPQQGPPQQAPPGSQQSHSLSTMLLTAGGDFYNPNGPFGAQGSSKPNAISPAGQGPSLLQSMAGAGKSNQQQPFALGPQNSMPLQHFPIGHIPPSLDPSAASPGAPPHGAFFTHPGFAGLLTQMPQPQPGQPQQQHQGGPPTPQPQSFFQLHPQMQHPPPPLQQQQQQPPGAIFGSRMPPNNPATQQQVMSGGNLQNLMANLQSNFGKSMNLQPGNPSAALGRAAHSPSPQFQQQQMGQLDSRTKPMMTLGGMPQQPSQNQPQQQISDVRKFPSDWNNNSMMIAAAAALAQAAIRPSSSGRPGSPSMASSITPQQLQSIINQAVTNKPQQPQVSQSQLPQQPIGSSIKPLPNQPQSTVQLQQQLQQNFRFLGGNFQSQQQQPNVPRPNSGQGQNGSGPIGQQPSPRYPGPGAIGQSQQQQSQQQTHSGQMQVSFMKQQQQVMQQMQGIPVMRNMPLQQQPLQQQQHQRQNLNQQSIFQDQRNRQMNEMTGGRSMSPKFLHTGSSNGSNQPNRPSPVPGQNGNGFNQQRYAQGPSPNSNMSNSNRPNKADQNDSYRRQGSNNRAGSDDVREGSGNRRMTPEIPQMPQDSVSLPPPPPFPGNDFARLAGGAGVPVGVRRDSAAVGSKDNVRNETDFGQISSSSGDHQRGQNMPPVPPMPHEIRMMTMGMLPPGQHQPQAIPPPLLPNDHHHRSGVSGARGRRGSNSTARRGSSTTFYNKSAQHSSNVTNTVSDDSRSAGANASPDNGTAGSDDGNASPPADNSNGLEQSSALAAAQVTVEASGN